MECVNREATLPAATLANWVEEGVERFHED